MKLQSPILAQPTAQAAPDWVPRRQKIWQIGGGLQCSIVGTCLSHDDLLRTARKCGVRLVAHLTTYDMHGYFVKEASSATRIAAALQKLLDKRYAVILARLDTCTSESERSTLWSEEMGAGRVAGAYWAFLTDTRVERTTFTRIFGEVHMMSHVQGRVAHQSLSRVSEMQATIEQFESRLNRLSIRNRELAVERDVALAAREKILPTPPSILAQSTPQSNAKYDTACCRDLEERIVRKERALVVARERARGAEQQAQLFRDKIDRLELLLEARNSRPPTACPAAEACAEAVRQDVSRKVLYIGGRTSMLEPLRRVAKGLGTEFVHHDGGLEQSVARIDALIESCDAVFCPIDCVSHSACLKAKALCKRFQKPFFPLRSSGASTFQRALHALA